jgi:hypothetical protein
LLHHIASSTSERSSRAMSRKILTFRNDCYLTALEQTITKKLGSHSCLFALKFNVSVATKRFRKMDLLPLGFAGDFIHWNRDTLNFTALIGKMRDQLLRCCAEMHVFNEYRALIWVISFLVGSISLIYIKPLIFNV